MGDDTYLAVMWCLGIAFVFAVAGFIHEWLYGE